MKTRETKAIAELQLHVGPLLVSWCVMLFSLFQGCRAASGCVVLHQPTKEKIKQLGLLALGYEYVVIDDCRAAARTYT